MKKKDLNDKSSLTMVIQPIEDEFFQDYSDDEANEETNRIFENGSRAATSMFYNNAASNNNSDTIKNSLFNPHNNKSISNNNDENRHDLFLNNEDTLSTRQTQPFSANLKFMNTIAIA